MSTTCLRRIQSVLIHPGSILALMSVLGACESTPAPSSPIFIGCPTFGCGTNGAWLGQDIVFHELDANGQANDAGVRMRGFRAPPISGQPDEYLELDVDGDRLQGKRSDGTLLEGKDLVGAVLYLFRGHTRWELKIVNVDEIGFWTGPEATATVYDINFSPANSDLRKWQPLCRPTKEKGFESDALQGSALFFRGDRYNALGKQVEETGPEDTWFNIACSGTAISKLHLLRHTLAGRHPDAQVTKVEQRQAVLKMLTGDYCGTGYPFTEDGHPLVYSYDQQWKRVNSALRPLRPDVTPAGWTAAESLDAIWNMDGAVCLDTPRLLRRFPSIREAIDHECANANPPRTLSPCSPWNGLQTDWGWTLRGGYAISANPPEQG